MSIEVIMDGKDIPLISHKGEYYIPSIHNKEYKIRLRNRHPERRLFVLSVDGVNVINGEEASFTGPGYVMEPWSSTVVSGYLRTHEEAAAFKFSNVGQSYAAQTGHGKSNVGVIGCAVFNPKQPTSWIKVDPICTSVGSTVLYNGGSIDVTNAPPSEVQRSYQPEIMCAFASTPRSMNMEAEVRSSGSVFASKKPSGPTKPIGRKRNKRKTRPGDAAAAAPQPQDMGTEYGRRVRMRTEETSFDREDKPSLVVSVRYASKQVLESWGVPLEVRPPAPQAFPGELVGARPPLGWQG